MLVLLVLCAPGIVLSQQNDAEDGVFPLNKPEQLRIRSRRPGQLSPLPPPRPVPPPTVSVPHPAATEWRLTLDEALRLALRNAEVIRVLTGTTAVSSGQTIYDPAIAHSSIDRELGAFDPVLSANNTFGRTGRAVADPIAERFSATHGNSYNLDVGLSQRNMAGGQGRLGFNNSWSRSSPRGVLNPVNQPSLEVSYTQPLLSGGGVEANRVPVVLARIDTERSYFRFKDQFQALTSSVIEGYWNLVFARTDLWARERQVDQARESYEIVAAQKRAGLGDAGDVAQQKTALANFRANLIAARAALLDREAAMKNVLGLPPNDGLRIIPVTPPTRGRIRFDWEQLINTANTNRPDLIELKLILDADRQRLVQAGNLSQPSLDAVALYRWNGISGELPTGRRIRSGLNQAGDFTIGVNFSVPVRLRAARASLRSAELLLARDRANLQQGQHAAIHQIAQTLRNLDSTWSQYEAFLLTREAALENLNVQLAEKKAGRSIFLNVLQAITDWGNAVSAEARTLTQYNAQLAQLERQTGTILQTHGIRFQEEMYYSLGPLGEHGDGSSYPQDLRAGRETERYENTDKPAEEVFNLDEYPSRSDAKGRKLQGDMPNSPEDVPPAPPQEDKEPPRQRGAVLLPPRAEAPPDQYPDAPAADWFRGKPSRETTIQSVARSRPAPPNYPAANSSRR